MFWAVAACLAAVVAVAILAPFLRPAGVAPARSDLRLYRAQLAEVDRDLSRGLILPDEAQRLRLEVGRRILEADRAGRRTDAAPRVVPAAGVAAVLVVLAVAAFALYQRIGAPLLPDQPIAARFAAAQASYRDRPSQAQAEAAAPPDPQPQASDRARLVEELRAAVARRPDDPQGLSLLADQEAQLDRPLAAVAAMRRLMALRGAGADAADHARLAGLMADAAGGMISPQAEAEIAAALRLDPAQPQARFMEGMLMIQNRRPDRAFPIWRSLLEDGPQDAPWTGLIRASIPDLAWLAGQPDYQPPAPGLRGPTGADVAAITALPEGEQRDMIEGMVGGLEARLAQQGGSAEEWAQLIRALRVLGRTDHAAEIATEARTRFAASPDALAAIEAAALPPELGPSPNLSPGPVTGPSAGPAP